MNPMENRSVYLTGRKNAGGTYPSLFKNVSEIECDVLVIIL